MPGLRADWWLHTESRRLTVLSGHTGASTDSEPESWSSWVAHPRGNRDRRDCYYSEASVTHAGSVGITSGCIQVIGGPDQPQRLGRL